MRFFYLSRLLLLIAAIFCGIKLVFVLFFDATNSNVRECQNVKIVQRTNILTRYPSHSQAQITNLPIASQPLNWHFIQTVAEPLTKICDADIIFVINSEPGNFKEREYMRNYIFTESIKTDRRISAFFVIGMSDEPHLDTKVYTEADRENDILLVNVIEHYHNITHKARAWITFLHNNCGEHKPKYVTKLDDDIMLDLSGFLELVNIFAAFKRIVLGRVYVNGPVVRNVASKWYLSKSEYAANSLGLYVQGMAYTFSFDLLNGMFDNLQKVQYLWMDDWYVTHGLMKNLSAIYFDLSKHYVSLDSEVDTQRMLKTNPKRSKLLFGHFRPKSAFPAKRRQTVWDQLRFKQLCPQM